MVKHGARPITPRTARLAVALLFGVNFLNYIDRYVIAAVAPLIQADFKITDGQLGLIGSMFMVAYMVASPFTGALADRYPRRWFVGSGVIVWSLATVASGLATGYRQLLDGALLHRHRRGRLWRRRPDDHQRPLSQGEARRMLAYFYVAIPVGSALDSSSVATSGPTSAGALAFFLAGAPGLVLGFLAFHMREPARGAGDGVVRRSTPSSGRRRVIWCRCRPSSGRPSAWPR